MGWNYLSKTVQIHVNSVTLFKDNASKLYAVISSFNDITIWKNTEDLLTESKRKADAEIKEKLDLLTSMSHSLLTPLNAILGYAQMLQYNPKAPLTEVQNDDAESILRGGNHLLDLVNEVLGLSSIEVGHFSLELEEVSAIKIIDDCLELMKLLCKNLNIIILNIFDDGIEFLLSIDD